jgi:hypothetical protein
MTAAQLQALAADVLAATLLADGLAEQARLRGLTATFGLPACDAHLIQKLRIMPAELRDTIIPKEKP